MVKLIFHTTCMRKTVRDLFCCEKPALLNLLNAHDHKKYYMIHMSNKRGQSIEFLRECYDSS